MIIDLPDSTRQVLRYRYPNLVAPERPYSALCLALSGRSVEVDWAAWSADEWYSLEMVAALEGVAPLLFWTWRHEGYPQAASPALRLHLKAQFVQAHSRQQRFLAEVNERILPALTPVITPLVLLKGAALAQALYPDPALRLMGDLDILVRQQQVDEAVRRLALAGYGEVMPYAGPTIRRLFSHHIHVSAPQRLDVEVHHSLIVPIVYPYALQLDWFWSQIEPLPGYPKISWLSPIAQLLHLAIHQMLQHGEAEMTLLKCYDMHLLIARCGARIDWDELAQQAHARHWVSAVLAALKAVALRFNTPLPEGYLASLQPATQDEAIGSTVAQRVHTTSLTKTGYWKTVLRTLSWPQKLVVSSEVAVPSPTYMRWRYRLRPAWLWPLAYFVRWFNGVRDTIRLIRMWFERDRSP